MTQKRRRFTSEFKARVVRAALREDKTLAQLAKEYQVHPNQITEWKRLALEALPEVFSKKKELQQKDQQALVDRLYRQIGELQVDVNWLKKNHENLGLTVRSKRAMLNPPSNTNIPPVNRQCELLGLSRSTAYYSTRPDPDRQAAEVVLINHIDQLYTDVKSGRGDLQKNKRQV